MLRRANTAVPRWRKIMDKALWIICMTMLLVSCGHQSPQRPSRWIGKAPEADSAQLALMEFNRQMAKSADEQLMSIAQEQEERYALYTGGTWVTILDRGDIDSPSPKVNEECVIGMQIYTLDGKQLADTKATYVLGKFELPYAVEANITEWHHGCRVRMYAPWYSAFGMKGTEEVPPYENVIIELELE